jgi:hypothetical protein
VGAFSTGIMVFGMSLLYGITGGTSLTALTGPSLAAFPVLPLVGALVFVLAGFGFKLALAPFHMWAPDVYEGAPTPITAFLSVAPKAAAFGMLIRFFQNHTALHVTVILAVVAAVTMTVGNLAALRQTNVKRMLAYSSIAQMGYVMMGLVAGGAAGFRAVLVYLVAYVLMNVGIFASVIAVGEDSQSESIEGFSGLAFRSLPLALTTTVFLLSLTGIPPLVGFIGKFSLFSATLQAPGLVWLAVVGAVNTVISLVYYFSIVRAMFFGPAARPESPRLPGPLTAVLARLQLRRDGGGWVVLSRACSWLWVERYGPLVGHPALRVLEPILQSRGRRVELARTSLAEVETALGRCGRGRKRVFWRNSATYVMTGSGKRVRPGLVFLAAQFGKADRWGLAGRGVGGGDDPHRDPGARRPGG